MEEPTRPICKYFYERGTCPNGDACPFDHPSAPVPDAPSEQEYRFRHTLFVDHMQRITTKGKNRLDDYLRKRFGPDMHLQVDDAGAKRAVVLLGSSNATRKLASEGVLRFGGGVCDVKTFKPSFLPSRAAALQLEDELLENAELRSIALSRNANAKRKAANDDDLGYSLSLSSSPPPHPKRKFTIMLDDKTKVTRNPK